MSVDARLLQGDIDAREDALDVTRSFIVQAPAGSGKTELLIQRYLRLLAIVDHPEEVLAITFTRKAAQEMRNRVLVALRNARDGVIAETRHEQKTLSLTSSVLKRDAENQWHLIQSPGRMRIETVDAFGAGIARSLPLSSGLGGAGTTVADAEMGALYRRAAAATLDHLALEDPSANAVERVLEHLDNNSGLYIAYLARMLGAREQWLSITGAGIQNASNAEKARQTLEANITNVVERHLAKVDRMLPSVARTNLLPLLQSAARNLIDDDKPDHLLACFVGTEKLPSADADDRLRWHALANLMLTQKGEWRKQVTRNDGFFPGDKARKETLFSIVETLRDIPGFRIALDRCRLLPKPEYEDGQWQVLLALFELLPLAVAELRRLFGENGITDHNEVALSAGRALGSSEVPGDMALMLDYQIAHLLIDEMQDTSIAQYQLLGRLTAGWSPGDGRTIFCVGDPMQSIYRFRNAEVGEFLLAKERGIGAIPLEPLTLRRNFRSGENLVHWFNTVFTNVLPVRDDVGAGAISYAESVPVEEKAGTGKHHVHALFDTDADGEAAYTLRVIEQCLQENEGEDVAVLVRSRTQLTSLLPRLRQAGIQYQAVEIERLTDLPEIIDLVALTRALCHEGDRLAWLALLRSPAAGLCWQDIHALVRNDTRRTVPELCGDRGRLEELSTDGRSRVSALLDILRSFLVPDPVRTLRETVELAWHAIGGPALSQDVEQLANVHRFLDTIDQIEVAGTLPDVRELESRLDAEHVSSTVDSQCRLQIMTMHKSKGLQFDHVVLPALGRSTRGSNKEVLSWLNLPDRTGRNEMVVSPVGPRAALENDPLHRYIEETEKDKNRLEQDRLLYVACTRARQSLQLIGSVSIAPDGGSLRNPVKGSLLARLWPVLANDFDQAFAVAGGISYTDDIDETDRYVLPRLRRMKCSWQTPQVANVPGAHGNSVPDVDNEEKPVEYYWVGSAARHAGTIIHRWLQRITEGQTKVTADGLDTLRPVTRRWAEVLGVATNELAPVCKRVEDALNGVLSDEKGCWITAGEGFSELPLTGVVDGAVESIVIDRVRIDEDGTHWIIDYKTSTHEGGDLAGFLQQESDRYGPQLAKYAHIYSAMNDEDVRVALYFPLLQAFCEVAV
ncbi:MAG: UvrD-helicase domain-containing protein [Woeseiaceae bacterium]|nr:UvrD-helicase domain-containing protein [Woeseiaceae bacterium]